jgi:hypothetical protein
MSNTDVNLPVEEVEASTIAQGDACVLTSSAWYFYWFTNPPAALAGRFRCTD